MESSAAAGTRLPWGAAGHRRRRRRSFRTAARWIRYDLAKSRRCREAAREEKRWRDQAAEEEGEWTGGTGASAVSMAPQRPAACVRAQRPCCSDHCIMRRADRAPAAAASAAAAAPQPAAPRCLMLYDAAAIFRVTCIKRNARFLPPLALWLTMSDRALLATAAASSRCCRNTAPLRWAAPPKKTRSSSPAKRTACACEGCVIAPNAALAHGECHLAFYLQCVDLLCLGVAVCASGRLRLSSRRPPPRYEHNR